MISCKAFLSSLCGSVLVSLDMGLMVLDLRLNHANFLQACPKTVIVSMVLFPYKYFEGLPHPVSVSFRTVILASKPSFISGKNTFFFIFHPYQPPSPGDK
ncbi:hypothetical protein ACH5RR_002577 [Cinchona calisaya]|uniref:Uncharacterized protein n=1 Tax=Cinchona calisaya TaxID=153742 RepID=A0ABD3ASG7_9GENT